MKISIVSSAALRRISALAVKTLKEKSATVATAESCTGGLIAKSITDIAGSSAVLAGGMVTYTNRIKTDVLGVDPAIIEQHTEVSHACAKAMAERAKAMFGTDYALSATGYAGPGGGTPEKPVGTVYVGIAYKDKVEGYLLSIDSSLSREEIRQEATNKLLALTYEKILENY